MQTTEMTTLMDAIAYIQADLQELKAQNEALQEQNRDLRMLLNGAMSTIPIVVRSEMQDFLDQFTEKLENREPSQTAEAIRELAGVLKDLKQRISDSELIHADMNVQVSYAAEEIRSFATRLFNSPLKDQIQATEPITQP